MSFVEVANVSEVPLGKMKRVEAAGEEILLANVDGTLYAVRDRCGHMNARLSMGRLSGNMVMCPLHNARFDVTTGKQLSDPNYMRIEDIQKAVSSIMEDPEKVAPQVKNVPERVVKEWKLELDIAKAVSTYNLPTFQVKVDGESILVDV